jgi:hypothetical protein
MVAEGGSWIYRARPPATLSISMHSKQFDTVWLKLDSYSPLFQINAKLSQGSGLGFFIVDVVYRVEEDCHSMSHSQASRVLT